MRPVLKFVPQLVKSQTRTVLKNRNIITLEKRTKQSSRVWGLENGLEC